MGKRTSNKHSKDNNAKNSKKLLIFSGTIIALVIAMSVYTINVKNTVKKWNDKIYPGIMVEDTEIGGLTQLEAKEKLSSSMETKEKDNEIIVKIEDKEFELRFSEIEPTYNIDKAIDEAMNINNDKSNFEKYQIIKAGKNLDIPIEITYNEEKLLEFEEKVKEEINTEAKNASINIVDGEVVIEKEMNGKAVDMDKFNSKVTEAIKLNKNTTIELELKETNADITAETLSKINGPIGEYSTNYATSAFGRATNIEIATKSINGTIVMPGEIFSFNKVVGERTVERGYKEAGTYVGNKVEPGIGGGICQVSTTLYRAAMRANVRSVERTNHSMVVGYVQPGLDATVSYGYLDYKFKNTYDSPIYIQGTTQGRVVTYTIYGDTNAKGNKTYEMINEIIGVYPPEEKEVPDETLKEGERVKEGISMTGYRVNSYQLTYEDGVQVNKELISTDNYAKVDSIVKVGTAEDLEKHQAPPVEGTLENEESILKHNEDSKSDEEPIVGADI